MQAPRVGCAGPRERLWLPPLQASCPLPQVSLRAEEKEAVVWPASRPTPSRFCCSRVDTRVPRVLPHQARLLCGLLLGASRMVLDMCTCSAASFLSASLGRKGLLPRCLPGGLLGLDTSPLLELAGQAALENRELGKEVTCTL